NAGNPFGGAAAVPEPSAILLALLGTLVGSGVALRRRRKFARWLLLCLVAAAAWPPDRQALATPLFWDANGSTLGSGTTPTGTWGTSVFWNTLSTGGAGVFTATTTTTDDLTFSAGSDAVGPYTVT